MITDTNMTPPEVREANTRAFREELAKIQNGGDDENTTEDSTKISNDTETDDTDSDNRGDISSDSTNIDGEKSDDSDDLDDIDSTGHMIPKGRFNKVIQQKKSVEKELEEERTQRIRAQAELDLYNKAMEKYIGLSNKNEPNTQEEFEPLDTEAHQYYLRQTKQIEEKFDQKIARLEQERTQAQVRQILETQEAEFSKDKPDFKKALDYYMDTQLKANAALYDTIDEAKQATMQQISATAQSLVYKGKNVAKTFYDMAKNFGYNPQGNSGPNIDAINQNMQKSKVANVNTVPLKPVGASSNLTTLKEFEKHYKGDKHSFYKMIEEERRKNK